MAGNQFTDAPVAALPKNAEVIDTPAAFDGPCYITCWGGTSITVTIESGQEVTVPIVSGLTLPFMATGFVESDATTVLATW